MTEYLNPGMRMGMGFIGVAVLLIIMLWWGNRKPVDRHSTSGHLGANVLIGLVAVGSLIVGLALCFVSLLVHVF